MIRNLKQIRKNDVHIAGGKGASLGEMMNAGFLIPDGFVITSDVFTQFLKDSGLQKDIGAVCAKIDYSDPECCFLSSQQITTKIIAQAIPQLLAKEILKAFDLLKIEFVAVRSSATSEDSIDSAWAGQLDTFLGIKRDYLLESVKKCWSSLYTERALVYRRDRALLNQEITVAVVIQTMVNSELSGTGFSVNPVTANTNEIIIDAGFGLGEAIVSGQITPDSYSVNKATKKTNEITRGEQFKALYQNATGGVEWRDISGVRESNVLSDDQLDNITNNIIAIETHYGFPCDIEWAISDNQLYILQSRPVTTLNSFTDLLNSYFKNLSDLRLSGRWSQPLLSCSFYVDWVKSNFITEFVPSLQFDAVSYIDDYAFVSAKDEEIYLNYLIELYYNGGLLAFSIQLDEIGNRLRLGHERFLHIEEGEKLSVLKEMLKSHLEFQSFWNFEAIGGDLILRLAKTLKYIEYDAQLFELVSPFLRKTWIEEEHDFIVSIAMKIPRDSSDVKKAINDSDEIQKQIRLYLAKYSWIGTDRWQGKQSTPEIVSAKIIEEYQNLEEGNHIELIPESNGLSDDPIIHLSVVTAYWRATCAGLTTQIESFYNSTITKISLLTGIAYENIIQLTYEELGRLIDNPSAFVFDNKMKERKSEFFICQNDLKQLTVLVPSDPIYYHLKNSLIPNEAQPADINELTGIGASGGTTSGKARIVFSRMDFNDFNEGEILVAPETTPAFVPLMRKAAAIITDRGGITSHAAIVGRELKKPVIIAVKNATKIIINNEELFIDAYKGIVKMIDR